MGLKNMGRRKKIDSVVFYTYPKLIFAWPVVILGPLLWLLTGAGGNEEVIGWAYLIVLSLVILTLSVDIERNHAAFWAVAMAMFFFLGKWLSEAKGFTLFGDVYNFLGGLDVSYDRGFGLALSLTLAVPYSVMIVWTRLQHRWRITHNEFEHYSWGRSDDSLARGAKRVRSTYPDLLEFLLCGAGTLIVYSATGRTELRRIPHVPWLFLVRKRINRLLESTSVTPYNSDIEESANEEDDRGGGSSFGNDSDAL